MRVGLGLLAIVVVFSVVFFLMTFDANRFEPGVRRQLETLTGNPVSIGKLTVTWRNGLGFELDDLRVFLRGQVSDRPAMSLESASVVLKILPLLAGKMQVATIRLKKPKFTLRRDKKGLLSVDGIQPGMTAESTEKPERPGKPSIFPFSFYAKRIVVESGEWIFQDESGKSSVTVPVDHVNATIRDFSLERFSDLRLSVEAAMAFFSESPNSKITGKIEWKNRERILELGDFRAELGLDSVNLAILQENVPGLKPLGLQDVLEGTVKWEIKKLRKEPKGIEDLQADIYLQGGRMRLSQLNTPVEEMNLHAGVSPDSIDVEDFSAKFAGGSFKSSGKVQDWQRKGGARFKAELDNIALENFLPALAANEPQLHGRTALSFQGEAAGRTWGEVSKSLSGRGRFVLKDGVMVNLSLLREVLGKLTMFPDLISELQKNLPEKAKTLLEKPDTIFEPFDNPFTVEGGHFALNPFKLTAEALEIKGNFEGDMTGVVSGKADLWVSGDFSESIAQAFPAMKTLKDSGGRMDFPLVFGGVLPKVALSLDLQTVALRLAPATAGSAVRILADKSSGKNMGTVSPKTPSELSLFGQWLDTAAKSVKQETDASRN
jgi:hypothetical protein